VYHKRLKAPRDVIMAGAADEAARLKLIAAGRRVKAKEEMGGGR